MARDFWANAFVRWQLPPLADFTDVLEKHAKSTRFVEEYWRRRDDAPAAFTPATQTSSISRRLSWALSGLIGMSPPASRRPRALPRDDHQPGIRWEDTPIDSGRSQLNPRDCGTRPLMSSSSHDFCPQRFVGPDLFLGKKDFTPTLPREQLRLIAEVR